MVQAPVTVRNAVNEILTNPAQRHHRCASTPSRDVTSV